MHSASPATGCSGRLRRLILTPSQQQTDVTPTPACRADLFSAALDLQELCEWVRRHLDYFPLAGDDAGRCEVVGPVEQTCTHAGD